MADTLVASTEHRLPAPCTELYHCKMCGHPLATVQYNRHGVRYIQPTDVRRAHTVTEEGSLQTEVWCRCGKSMIQPDLNQFVLKPE